MMVRYCLCHVARATASELALAVDTPFKPALRRSLFDALALGCEEGSQGLHPTPPLSSIQAGPI